MSTAQNNSRWFALIRWRSFGWQMVVCLLLDLLGGILPFLLAATTHLSGGTELTAGASLWVICLLMIAWWLYEMRRDRS